jgi:tetratricopeptide (TPR) repeat protein
MQMIVIRVRKACLLFAFLFLIICAKSQQVSEPVQRLYAEAKSEEQANHLDAAIQKYLEILALSPNLAAAYNNVGRLYYQQAEYDKAIGSLEKACKLEPSLAAPHALLGFSFFQTSDFETARKELEISEKLDARNTQVKLFLARSLMELGEIKGAATLLQSLQQEDPNNPEVLYTLGFVYSDLAESTFRRIQEVDPTSYLVELLLGKAAEAKQVYVDAAEHYKNAIAKAPDVWELYFRYGHSLYMANQVPEALEAYRHALKLNPYAYDAQWEAARILVSDKPEEAYALASSALKGRPGSQEVLVIRGQALLSLNRPKEAVEDLKKASALDPENESCHVQLGRAYRQLGLTEEAKAEYATVERLQQAEHERAEEKLRNHLESSEHNSKEMPPPQSQ